MKNKLNSKINNFFNIAFKNHKNNNFNKARDLYTKVLTINPNHFEAIFLLGSLSVQTNDYKNAKNYFEKAIKIMPNDPKVCYNLGVINVELDNISTAIKYYEKAIFLKPDHTNSHNNLGQIFLKLGKGLNRINVIMATVLGIRTFGLMN